MIFSCHITTDDDDDTQGAHLEQSTPYHALSELTAALMTIIVEPDRKGRIIMEEFAEAMPTEVGCVKTIRVSYWLTHV